MTDNQFSIPLQPQEFQVKAALLAAQGVHIVGNSGNVSAHGVTLTYSYDGTNLLLTVVQHPVWVTTSHCIELLKKWITA